MFANVQDAQGVANTFVAHAEARCADSYYAGHCESPGPLAYQVCIAQCARAREEYTQAAALYSALLKRPELYSLPRQKQVHKAMATIHGASPRRSKGLKFTGGRQGPGAYH